MSTAPTPEQIRTPYGIKPLQQAIDMVHRHTMYPKLDQGVIAGMFGQIQDIPAKRALAEFILAAAPESGYKTLVTSTAQKWLAQHIAETTVTKTRSPNGVISKQSISDLLRSTPDKGTIRAILHLRQDRPNFWPTLRLVPHMQIVGGDKVVEKLARVSEANKHAGRWIEDAKPIEAIFSPPDEAGIVEITRRLYGHIDDMDIIV